MKKTAAFDASQQQPFISQQEISTVGENDEDCLFFLCRLLACSNYLFFTSMSLSQYISIYRSSSLYFNFSLHLPLYFMFLSFQISLVFMFVYIFLFILRLFVDIFLLYSLLLSLLLPFQSSVSDYDKSKSYRNDGKDDDSSEVNLDVPLEMSMM